MPRRRRRAKAGQREAAQGEAGRAVLAMLLAAVVLTALLCADQLRRARAQDLPWTPLDLRAPIGLFTARKLAGLHDDAPRCLALLRAAGVRFERLAPVSQGSCGYADGVRLLPGSTARIGLTPGGVGMSCAMAASLTVWETRVVQPAAARYYGSPATRLEHFGGYNCRHIAGSPVFSEHAHANAIDIAAVLVGDHRITVARDWRGDRRDAAFLHAVRDGACRLFATTLSPDFNRAHHDHLHLDQAARGAWGWAACR